MYTPSPLLLILYSCFMSVLIPVYWYSYGLINFLYFCDITLILTYIGSIIKNRLLISISAVGILIPQALWIVDFIFTTCGYSLMHMTDYMYQDKYSYLLRGLSLFHLWLPFLLLYLLGKWGYDSRAVHYWNVIFFCVIVLCYNIIDKNINFIWGLGDKHQTSMHHTVWFVMVLLSAPTLIYYPTHYILKRFY
jgi:hypothetical protein